MIRKHLVGAVATALGLAVAAQAAAVTPRNIHTGRLGRVQTTTLAQSLHLEAGNSFQAGADLHTVRGTRKTRERQVFNGVPVYGRSLVVERDRSGNVLRTSGQVERNLGARLSRTQPQLSADQAQAALEWQLGQNALGNRNAESKLFVLTHADGSAGLAYRVSYLVTINGKMSRPTALVDANTGAVIRHWNGLTSGRRGPGPVTQPTPVDAYGIGGNEKTGMYVYGSGGPGLEPLEAMRIGSVCYMQNQNVATYNVSGGNRLTLWSFGCGGSGSTDANGLPSSSNWFSEGDATNGAYSPINDAHHFGQVVHDMYTDWFGKPPLMNSDGSPMQLSMWVHYGTNYENAFWDGAEMVFGDGDQYFYPFVVLDITGHEISHGFTEQHAGLEYTGQSGGMNEAFSDMAGEAVKYYDRGSNDFLTGSDIVKPDTVPLLGLDALRDMCDPPRDGVSIDNEADYYDGIDVHYSSGVYNKAFCTLAKTSGWNTKMAFEVFHDANATYWSPTETFDSGACGVEQAATDRGYSSKDVTAAFTAVGVTCRPPR